MSVVNLFHGLILNENLSLQQAHRKEKKRLKAAVFCLDIASFVDNCYP